MFTFEDKADEIHRELEKRRAKWQLKALAWLDFDDVSQIIKLHIYKQWDKWDQEREFMPWLSKVIKYQTINIMRNLYTNVARPCVKNCAANEGGDRCRIYGQQCADCPLYAHWERTKKKAYDVKLPVSIEDKNNLQAVYGIESSEEDIEGKISIFHDRMKDVLTPIQYKVYKLLYVDCKTENEVAEAMGYKTSEKHRNIGYRQVHNMKKVFLEKGKKIILNEFY